MSVILAPANKTVREKVLLALRTRAYRRNEIITFPEVRRVLSWYRYGKQEREKLLYELREEGVLTLVPFHGVILKDTEV